MSERALFNEGNVIITNEAYKNWKEARRKLKNVVKEEGHKNRMESLNDKIMQRETQREPEMQHRPEKDSIDFVASKTDDRSKGVEENERINRPGQMPIMWRIHVMK